MTKKVSMRDKFPPNQIGKLPKPTKAQTDKVKANFKEGMRCKVCKGWHHKDVIHLDYVGHAPLTDRMLDVDANWNWEPLATTEQGLPLFDAIGGLWIKLTIDGVTRIGYGNAPDKGSDGNREKEVIGDALRNAAMRFGAALDLWHKGDLHLEEPEEPKAPKAVQMPKRSEINKKLQGMGDIAVFNGYAKAFSATYSISWEDSSGKQGGKESWANLFGMHKDRINKVPPIDTTKGPKEIQEEFILMANKCQNVEDYQAIADFQDSNPCLNTQENVDTVLELARDFS